MRSDQKYHSVVFLNYRHSNPHLIPYTARTGSCHCFHLSNCYLEVHQVIHPILLNCYLGNTATHINILTCYTTTVYLSLLLTLWFLVYLNIWSKISIPIFIKKCVVSERNWHVQILSCRKVKFPAYLAVMMMMMIMMGMLQTLPHQIPMTLPRINETETQRNLLGGYPKYSSRTIKDSWCLFTDVYFSLKRYDFTAYNRSLSWLLCEWYH